MLKYSFPLSFVYNTLQYRKSKVVDVNSHQVSSQILSKFMAEKNSFPALYYQYLKMIFEINGYVGIGALPKESLYSKPRVTRCKMQKITLAVFEQFSNFAKREIL